MGFYRGTRRYTMCVTNAPRVQKCCKINGLSEIDLPADSIGYEEAVIVVLINKSAIIVFKSAFIGQSFSPNTTHQTSTDDTQHHGQGRQKKPGHSF
jgi:hypothetical protein